MAFSNQSGDYSIELGERPCAVKYVKEWSSFLVGTYILLPTVEDAKSRFQDLSDEDLTREYKRINQRAGSLVLLARDEGAAKFGIKGRLSCSEGGVFDFSVLDGIIYVAHANNTVGIYECINETNLMHVNTTKLDQAQASSTTLLTSIDTRQLNASSGSRVRTIFAVAGDSQGFITIIDVSDIRSCEIIARTDVTKSQDPVWSVKFMPVFDAQPEECPMLIVACENCSWYIYQLDCTKSNINLIELFKKQDRAAGVTSICFGPRTDPEQTVVMLGSYDEHIELFTVNTHSKKQVHPVFLNRIRVHDGGIWRMTPVNESLYVAAMYAGSFKCSLGNRALTELTKLPFETAKLPADELGDDGEASLHYDIDISLEHNTICVADFNKSLCILSDRL